MERENHRVIHEANCSPIKNQYEHAELKDPRGETGMQEEKHFRTETIDGREDEESLSSHEIFGLCAICHLTLGRMNFNQNENAPCSKGHTLCQRCVQRFTVSADRGCILCHAECRQSSANLSRQSSVSLNSVRVKRTLNPRPKSDYSYQRDQQQRANAEQLYGKTLARSGAPFAANGERSLLGYCTDDNSGISGREQFRDRSTNPRDGRAKDDDRRRQQLSSCNLFKKGNGEPCDAKVNGQITAECSRRPIRCPRIDCAINVAFSALTHHFVFDHPEVPVLNVEPGVKSTLIVSFSALTANCSRCLALLLVSGKLSDPVARLFNGCQINPKYRNRLPLPVLAARLQSTDQHASNEKISKRNLCQKDVIIAWVAGLDVGNPTEKLLCSIQAVDKIDNEGLRSLTYTGPVNSLRTAQCPRDIFSAGDCIVLHEGLLGHITSDCVTLNVNVTVH